MIEFYKMHGTGNDYIYFDCFVQEIVDPEALAVKLSDRHFGIGGDGIILIKPSENADCFMDMYNADGSRGKMCGNGIRCVARFMYDKGRVSGDTVQIDTLSGIKDIRINTDQGRFKSVTVDMGAPALGPGSLPALIPGQGPVIGHEIVTEWGVYAVTLVSMGNPHAVIFVDDTSAAPVERVGRIIENHELFPEKINVEFIRVIDRKNIEMRVWERGSGETLACGTGACASVVACVLNGLTETDVTVRLPGGSLDISWDRPDGSVWMTGEAIHVFRGCIE